MSRKNGHDHESARKPEPPLPPKRPCPRHGEHWHWWSMTFTLGDKTQQSSPNYCAYCIREWLDANDSITKVAADGRT